MKPNDDKLINMYFKLFLYGYEKSNAKTTLKITLFAANSFFVSKLARRRPWGFHGFQLFNCY